MSTTQSLPAATPGFPLPQDSQAWWGVLLSLLAGWALSLGPRLDPRGLPLAVAALSLFLGSEWFSQLAGRSRQGQVAPARLKQPLGLGLLGLTALSLAWFLYAEASPDRQAWGTVVTAVGCLVALMFILRLEWRPLDARLLYLSHLILTLPALVLGFVAWGPYDPRAFGLWLLPAAFFPAQALFAQFWMEGSEAPRAAFSSLAGPLLLSALLQALRADWTAVGFLGAFLLWSLLRLAPRRSAEGLPSFQTVRRLDWELQAWNLAFLACWVLGQR